PSAPSPAAAPARPTARLEVRAGSLIVIDGERALAPGCEREADPDAPTFVEEPRPEAVARCVERLGDRAIILAIEGGVPFGRVAALAASLAPRPISLTLLR
ncbi:MAG: hypothetical protein IT378_21035, partial [Sandaracinaceae bacterium]|nr:hypothetical protein [Sandaracinaceae bacterium]